jgi:hypothetical protein
MISFSVPRSSSPKWGVDPPDHLTIIEFQHQAQHPVRRWVLRSKIDREMAERSFGHGGLVSRRETPCTS